MEKLKEDKEKEEEALGRASGFLPGPRRTLVFFGDGCTYTSYPAARVTVMLMNEVYVHLLMLTDRQTDRQAGVAVSERRRRRKSEPRGVG